MSKKSYEALPVSIPEGASITRTHTYTQLLARIQMACESSHIDQVAAKLSKRRNVVLRVIHGDTMSLPILKELCSVVLGQGLATSTQTIARTCILYNGKEFSLSEIREEVRKAIHQGGETVTSAIKRVQNAGRLTQYSFASLCSILSPSGSNSGGALLDLFREFSPLSSGGLAHLHHEKRKETTYYSYRLKESKNAV